MAEQPIINISTPPNPEPEKWGHELDAKKAMMDVHMDFRDYLSKDYKMSHLTGGSLSKRQELIMDLVPAAIMVKEITPLKEIGVTIQNDILVHCHSLCIVCFNEDGNMFVDRMSYWEKETRQDVGMGGEDGWLKRFGDKLSGKKKPKLVEEE